MDLSNVSSQAIEEARIEAELDAEDARFFVTLRRWMMVGLLIVGVGLVLAANSLGIVFVKGPYGVWNPSDAAQAALTIRTVGVMAFGAGLVERIVLCWEKAGTLRPYLNEENPRA